MIEVILGVFLGGLIGALVAVGMMGGREKRLRDYYQKELAALVSRYSKTAHDLCDSFESLASAYRELLDAAQAREKRLLEVVLDQAREGKAGTGYPLDPLWGRSSLEEGDQHIMDPARERQESAETADTVTWAIRDAAPHIDHELAVQVAREMRESGA